MSEPGIFLSETFGGPSDLWESQLSSSILNSYEFGVALQIELNSGQGFPLSFLLDAISLNIYYEPIGNPFYSTTGNYMYLSTGELLPTIFTSATDAGSFPWVQLGNLNSLDNTYAKATTNGEL